jgi:hypothetical protein
MSTTGFVDRIEQLRLSNTITGIDFVQVAPTQTTLHIFLQHDVLPAGLIAALGALAPSAFIIEAVGAVTPARVIVTQHITPLPLLDGRHALRLVVAQPGGFGDYALRINSPAIDPYYNDIRFSFKANCDSQFDCAQEPPCCPEEPSADYPVDYRGRDFWSLRQTLFDFASQRYPDWQDRLEADFGVVAVELLAALRRAVVCAGPDWRRVCPGNGHPAPLAAPPGTAGRLPARRWLRRQRVARCGGDCRRRAQGRNRRVRCQ